MANKALLTTVTALAGMMAASCLDTRGTTVEPDAPRGWARVRTITAGVDVDADGYTLIVDRSRDGIRVSANDTALVSLRAGFHHIALGDIAPNCVTSAGRGVEIRPDTLDVVFTGTCVALGGIEMTLLTSGSDPDPNGYSVTGPFAEPVPVPANGTVMLPRLAAGEYAMALNGVAANCDVVDLHSRSVAVVSGVTIPITFNISCVPVTLLAYASNDGEIYTINSNGTGRTRLTYDGTKDEDPAWSPDGNRIAFTSHRDGNIDIYLMSADGSDPLRLTTHPAWDSQPSWSPDGRRIVFVSARDGSGELYVMNADGSNPVRLTNNPAADVEPAWSPDGSRIAFTSHRHGNAEIYLINADGTGERRLTSSARSLQPSWSPDGSRLALVRLACHNCSEQIVVVNAVGGLEFTLADGYEPAWSPDGRLIAYRSVSCDFYGYTCKEDGLGIARVDGTGYEILVSSSAFMPSWRR